MKFEEFLENQLQGKTAEIKQVFESIDKMDFEGAGKETDKLISGSQDEDEKFLLGLLKAYVELAMNKYEEVIDQLQTLLKMAPENYYCYYFYGLCLRNLNYPWEALKYFEKAKTVEDNEKVNEQIHNTEGIIKVAENKALQIIAFKEVPEKYKFLG